MTAHSGEEARALRVLHVEDNAGDVRLIAEALRELGIALEVYVAPDGSQALIYRGCLKPLARLGSFGCN
jgi:hypothetical protein